MSKSDEKKLSAEGGGSAEKGDLKAAILALEEERMMDAETKMAVLTQERLGLLAAEDEDGEDMTPEELAEQAARWVVEDGLREYERYYQASLSGVVGFWGLVAGNVSPAVLDERAHTMAMAALASREIRRGEVRALLGIEN